MQTAVSVDRASPLMILVINPAVGRHYMFHCIRIICLFGFFYFFSSVGLVKFIILFLLLFVLLSPKFATDC